MKTNLVLAIVTCLAIGCGGSEPGTPSPDGSPPADSNTTTFPAWMLEDVQPQSPLVGQTYGLETFSGKIVVVTLLEGF